MTEDFSVYGDAFWAQLNATSHRGLMAKMGQALGAELHPTSVLDVGAGLGTLVLQFEGRGHIMPIESTFARSYVEKYEPSILERYTFTDLDESDATWPTAFAFDVAVSIEVAEHLPRAVGERLVRYLCAASSVVWFSAAFPGQHGDGHINERPWMYWESLFAKEGFFPDIDVTARLRAGYEPEIGGEWWYRRCVLFRRRV